MKRSILLTLTLAFVAIGCIERHEPPPPAVVASPGPPRYWDVGSQLLKHPLPGDMSDGYLEFGKAPNCSYGATLVRDRLSARSHERSDMLLYVHRGSARFSIGEKDYSAATGDMLFVPRGAVYTATCQQGESLELITIYSPPLNQDDIEYHERSEQGREGVSKTGSSQDSASGLAK